MLKHVTIICVFITLTKQNVVPVFKTNQGPVKGTLRKSLNGREFSSFTGIPYAEPPIGDLRFKAAVPARTWKGELDATKPHAHCPQLDVFTDKTKITGDEDCLYLNVYTPQTKQSSNQTQLPVMFYIHGGGWTCGEANLYGPDILLNYDIVLVTINYRLGALGFLTTGDHEVPGNNGLKDQNLALKWVKNNIIYFGGDPNSITIFGQSAGGASTHFHTLSPLSKDLIKGAIIQSGSAVAPWALGSRKAMPKNTKKLAKLLNCPYTTSEMLVNCLRKIPAHEIVKRELQLKEWSYHPIVIFKPVIEDISDQAFLTEEPADIIKSNKASKVPIIVGFTTEDGVLSTSYVYNKEQLLDDLNDDFHRVARLMLFYDEIESNQTEKIRNFYFGKNKIDDITKTNYTNLFTDGWFHLSAHNTVQLHSQYTQQSVYYYLFGYRGTESFSVLFSNGKDESDYGVCHGDDIIYLFNLKFSRNKTPTKEDLKMNNFLSTLWTNFAKTGNPTPNIDDATAIWDPVKTSNFEYYLIKDESVMQDNMNSERLNFWKGISFNPRSKNIRDEL